jgi:uncharacterized protein
MIHASHPRITKRLKRVEGHLRATIAMIENGRSCADLAQQLHAIERAIATAKRELIHDHIDHCLDGESRPHGKANHASMVELKTLTKYL